MNRSRVLVSRGRGFVLVLVIGPARWFSFEPGFEMEMNEARLLVVITILTVIEYRRIS